MQGGSDGGTTTGAAPTRRLRQDQRYEQLLRAAAAAFARGGFAATSMDDVATAAGVTRLIVYRHFDTKEELYRAVLERVADRVRDKFLEGLHQAPPPRGFVVGSMLAAAREQPDGFRLLTGHAAREPQFVALHHQWWSAAEAVADRMVGSTVADPALRAWADHTVVAYLVDSVVAWLDTGDPAQDGEFVELGTRGLQAMVHAWGTGPGPGGGAA
jgi:AcrR family transcriptional regulator